MNRLITIYPDTKDMKLINKKEDMTCEVEIKGEGLFDGVIENISSSGKYGIRLINKVEAK